MTLLDWFSDSSTVLLVVNSILYSKKYNSESLAYRFFTIYLLLMALNQIVVTILHELEITNLFLSNVYIIVQFLMLSLFYNQIFKNKSKRKYVITILYIVLAFLGVQYSWTPGLFNVYNTIGIILTLSILILYSIIYFFYSLSDDKLKFLIVNSGILIYLLGTILIFSIANLGLDFDRDTEIILWIVNAFVFLVFQCIIFFEWFRNYRTKKQLLEV